MLKRRESAEQLRERILSGMQKDIGISEQMAEPFVESIMRCFAGERPYFPALQRDYPLAAIRSALESGVCKKDVMERFKVSRSKLHQLFPGGLPPKAKSS